MTVKANGTIEDIDGNRWPVFALVIGTRVAVAVQIASVGALGPALLADPTLGLDYTGLGGLIGAYMLPGAMVALPAGWLSARIGERRMVIAGLGFSIAGGLALAASTGFATSLAARLTAGVGAALLSVVLSAMVMARFAGRALAPAMGGFLAAYPFGVGLAMVALPALAAATLSWRVAMLGVAAGCALALAAVPLALVAGERVRLPAVSPEVSPVSVAGRSLLHRGEWGPVLAAGTAWGTLNAGFVVLLGFAPTLLAERGASPESAGALASLTGWASIPLAPLGGTLVERTGRPMLATLGCLVAVAAAIIALAARVGPQSGALLAAGLLISIAATVIMTLPARSLAPESRTSGMGVYYTIYYIGMATLPPLAGWAADGTGSAVAALQMAAMFIVAAAVSVSAYAWLEAAQRARKGSGGDN